MANRVYPNYSIAAQKGLVDILTGDVRLMIVKTAQAFDPTHEFVSDLTGANIVQRTSTGLTGKTLTVVSNDAVFDANEPSDFSAVTAGDDVILIMYINDSDDDSLSRLVWYCDTGSGIPRTTDGGDIPVTWSNAARKIFALLS